MAIPSGYTALDFVGFTDKGTYANNVTYVINDLVHYGGDIWKCKIDNTIGITPAVGANWDQWLGASANLVERIIAPLEQNPATIAYGVGRQIIWDDWLWEVIAPIAVGDTLVDYAVDPTNANIKKSDPVETQLLAIKNGLGTAAAKDVPASGNASTTQVVMGNDTRLTDARNAADVSAWAKASSKPAYSASEISYGTGSNVGSEIQALTNQTDGIESVVSQNGAKNLCPNYATTQTDNEVTWRVQSDGRVIANVTSVPSAWRTLTITGGAIPIKNGRYKLVGTPSNNGDIFIRATSQSSNQSWTVVGDDYGNGVMLDITESNIAITLEVKSGCPVGSYEFRPMITLADQPNSDYAHFVPYAMTNRELTEELMNGYLIRSRLIQSVTVDSTNDTRVDFSENKPGYTPIMATVSNTYVAACRGGSENYTFNNGSFTAKCFFKHVGSGSQSINVYCDVLWFKNT